MFFSSLIMPNFIVGESANLYGNHWTIGVTREPLLPMIRMMTQSLLFIQFLLAFFRVQQYTRTIAISIN